MECIISRHHLGHLCGYVITNKRLDDIIAYTLNVHGGITFNSMVFHGGINKYAVGFDCASHGDYIHFIHYVDGKYNVLPWEEYTYRDIEYVTNELQRLTEQLKDIKY